MPKLYGNFVQAHVMHPSLLELCLSFYTTTAQWLVHLVAKGSHDSQMTSCDVASIFPLPDKVWFSSLMYPFWTGMN